MERVVLNETSYFGYGSISELKNIIKQRGYKRVLALTDAELIKFGVFAKVENVLNEAKVKYTTFSNIQPNPTVENVQEGLKVLKKM